MKTQKLAVHNWIIFPMVLVALGVCSISTLVLMIGHAQYAIFDDIHRMLLAHVQDRAHLLVHANASVFNIARVLNSPPDKNLSSFSAIESKVAPWLFIAFTTISSVSQISYVGFDGLMLSYYHDGDQVLTMFSNTSHSSDDSTTYHWYNQAINMNSGERYDNVTVIDSLLSNDSEWFHNALNGKNGYASWGSGWGKARKPMFFFTAPIAKIGVVSLGVAVKDFTDYLSGIDLHGGHLYLATKDGHFLSQTGPPHASYVLSNDTITLHVMEQNDILMEEFVNIPCPTESYMDTTIGPLISNDLNIWGKRYEFSCAPLDVAGIQLVSVMMFPHNNTIRLIQKMKIVIVSLLSLLILSLVLGSYILLQIVRGIQVQETFLHANIIKQNETIQQAERKSMNKSLAFASASHDVRTSLAGITGLIELCRGDAPPNSILERNLVQMNVCASKLLGILNSVLDTSKVEAGKMQLEDIEFDMAQVLEESVDIFHVVALRKGLEVIWDPCDYSVLRSSCVKGDCKRLKQILDNLLGNAVKFTSKGHIVLRAWSKKPSLENFKLSHEHGCHFLNMFNRISRWLSKDQVYTDLGTLNSIQHDPNSIEFIFEVDDTGMGISKEKRSFVFENYVQVKESTPGGHEGTGLGLGIVQSFVRLMGGEISIQDKEPGERGTCFRFNIFVMSNDKSSSGGEDTNPNSVQVSNQLHIQSSFITNVENTLENVTIQSSVRAMTFQKGLKIEGIHSLLFVQGDETRRVVQRWMISLGIKVWEIHHWELLSSTLEHIKHHLNASGKFDPTTSPSISLNRATSQKSNIKAEGFDNIKDEADTLPLTTKDRSKKKSFTDCLPTPRGNLKQLKLEVELDKYELPSVTCLLRTLLI